MVWNFIPTQLDKVYQKNCKSKTLPKQNIAKAKHCQSKTLPLRNIAGYTYLYLRTFTKFVSVWTSSLKTLCLGLMDFKSKFVELVEAIDVATDSIFGT